MLFIIRKKITFLADLEQSEVEQDLILAVHPVLVMTVGDVGSGGSCWLLIESACVNGPLDTPSSVIKTLGARFLPRGLKIVGISPSLVITPSPCSLPHYLLPTSHYF